jgi:hypothetical protein
MIREERHYHENTIDQSSIKEGVDQINSGLCFYIKGGRVILANSRMNALCHAIAGHALQDAQAFWKTLSGGEVQPDVKRLYFAIKNELDRCGVQNSRVYASIQTGLALVTLATLMFDTMMSQFQRQTLVNITHAFLPGRLTAMESCWKAVGEITGKKVLKDVNLRDNEQCRLGVEVILQRYERADFLNEAAGVALRHNLDILSHEERKAFLQDDELWNQENNESV